MYCNKLIKRDELIIAKEKYVSNTFNVEEDEGDYDISNDKDKNKVLKIKL